MLCRIEHDDPYFLLHFSDICNMITNWTKFLRNFLILPAIDLMYIFCGCLINTCKENFVFSLTRTKLCGSNEPKQGPIKALN